MNNYLESQIDKLVSQINDKKLGFAWKNHPNRTHGGSYLEGEPFDYCILTKKYKVCFDAKETDKSTWAICKKDIVQAKNLYLASLSGIECFFLIYFITQKKLVRIKIDKFLEILAERKHIKMNDCVTWDYRRLLDDNSNNNKSKSNTSTNKGS